LQYSRFYNNISWLAHSFKQNRRVENLYNNGDFSQGLTYWQTQAPDSIIHNIIDTEYGKAVRIKRYEGIGYWSLVYKGREVYYHKDLTYNINFKCRVIEGENIPFKVGWWVKEYGCFQNDLQIEVKKMDKEWLDCSVSYTFNNYHKGLISFINSQTQNSIIDIADIKLTCNDTMNRPMYVDQLADIRLVLWENAISVWKEHLLFGFGIGDSKNRLIENYSKKKINEALENNYNTHNQFLETATQTGLVGLTVLLLVFAIPLYQSIKKKQELLFLFLMICFINFLFESMLERLAGVVFFAFWYGFLWFVYYKDEEVEKNTIQSP
jgi:hypothetical protein